MKKILFTLTLIAALSSARAGWLDALGLGSSSTNSTAASAGNARAHTPKSCDQSSKN